MVDQEPLHWKILRTLEAAQSGASRKIKNHHMVDQEPGKVDREPLLEPRSIFRDATVLDLPVWP